MRQKLHISNSSSVTTACIPMSATGATNGFSDYERERASRIAFNKERLRSSGLEDVVVALSRPNQSTKAPAKRKEKGVVLAVREQPPRNVKQHLAQKVHAQLYMLNIILA